MFFVANKTSAPTPAFFLSFQSRENFTFQSFLFVTADKNETKDNHPILKPTGKGKILYITLGLIFSKHGIIITRKISLRNE